MPPDQGYDVTIKKYRKSHTNIEVRKMYIMRRMGSKFCVKFQRCPYNAKYAFSEVLKF